MVRKSGAKAGVKQGSNIFRTPSVVVALIRKYEVEAVRNMLVDDRNTWMKKNGCNYNTFRNWLANKDT